jgi:acetyl-CoA synthetase
VVGFPHDIKGQGIYAYVTLKAGERRAEERDCVELVKQQVRKEIGPIATPDASSGRPGLPKTRSGKIMRRILRKIAECGLQQQRRSSSSSATTSCWGAFPSGSACST